MAKLWTDCLARRTSVRAMILAALVAFSFAGEAFAQAVALTITKSFNPSTVAVGGDSILTITVTNPNAFPVSLVQFSDTMPAGIDLITQTGGDCSTLATGGGMFSINPGTETFSSTSNVLAPGQSCSITVRVRPTTVGPHLNTTSQVTGTGFPPGGPATATLTAGAPPTISKAFGAASIDNTASTTLSFTLSNPNAASSLTGVGFADTLPTGLVVATPEGLAGSCGGGTITAAAGTNTISLAGATLAGGASCTFTVNVTATTAGPKNNTTTAVTSVETGPGNAATASITVGAAPIPALSSFGQALVVLIMALSGLMFLRRRLAPVR